MRSRIAPSCLAVRSAVLAALLIPVDRAVIVTSESLPNGAIPAGSAGPSRGLTPTHVCSCLSGVMEPSGHLRASWPVRCSSVGRHVFVIQRFLRRTVGCLHPTRRSCAWWRPARALQVMSFHLHRRLSAVDMDMLRVLHGPKMERTRE